MDGLKNGHIHKNLTQNGEPQRYSWGTQKKKKKNRDKVHTGAKVCEEDCRCQEYMSVYLLFLFCPSPADELLSTALLSD